MHKNASHSEVLCRICRIFERDPRGGRVTPAVKFGENGENADVDLPLGCFERINF
jgi:hypothetical protein